MKNISSFILIFLVISLISCEEENPALDNLGDGTDEIHEFVHLSVEELSMGELENSTEGNEVQVHARLMAYPRAEDVTLTVTVAGVGATENVDFEVVGPFTITIKSGEVKSDPGFLIKSIDNFAPNGDRSIVVTLVESSDPSLIIGNDLSDNPGLLTTSIIMIDDDCSDDFTKFGNQNIQGTASEGGYIYDPFDISFTSSISGDLITLEGEYTGYFGNTLTVQAVPNTENVTIGELVFTEEYLGDGGDGAFYRALPTDGLISTFDACNGLMTIYYDYEYSYDDTNWSYWYSAVLELEIAPCTNTYEVFDSSTMAGSASEGGYMYDPFPISFQTSLAGDLITLNGEYTNYHGNTLTLQAVPDSSDPTIGTLVWTEELLGSDGYGAIYHALPTEGKASTYNACTGEMTIYYDYEWNYEAGAGWEYWYSAELTISKQ